MKTIREILALLLLATAAAEGHSPTSTAATESEALHYRWRIEGASGLLVRLLPFFPVAGTSVIRTEHPAPGMVRYVFRSTSEQARAGDHWTYSSEFDLARTRTTRVVDRLLFRTKDKNRVYEIEDEAAVDLLSGLFLLREREPDEPLTTTLWSNRRLYPVRIEPRGLVQRTVEGKTRRLRQVAIHGVRQPGIRYWSGDVGIWFEPEAPKRPVEILFQRSLGRIRLTLLPEAPIPN